jgi:putative SOS response-associated peptidase YedK
MLVAIRPVDGERVPKMMKWGLIPHWAKDDKFQFSTFNARAVFMSAGSATIPTRVTC